MTPLDQSQLDIDLVREIGKFTTALFPITSHEKESIDYPGTGTFVSLDGAHFVLTATHVWEVISRAPEVGLALRETLNHKYAIPREAFAVFGPPRRTESPEWGPDLAMVRLPPWTVGEIEVHKAFYNLRRSRRAEGSGGILVSLAKSQEVTTQAKSNFEVEGRVLMGTPKVKATLSPQHASVEIDGMFLALDAQEYVRDSYDYIDFEIQMTPSIPTTFKGVSGGGLWRFFNRVAVDTGKTTAEKVLEGVAFYQSPLENESRTIRCHGKRSIQNLMQFVPS